RKQSRLFRNAEYCCHGIQGREITGRRDDRVLFACLTNPDQVKPWVNVLSKYKTPLAGIYSTALISHLLLPELDIDSTDTLLVSLQRNAGLRQTFFKNKEFKFSRLVKLPRYGTAAYAPLVHDEVEKMLRFLRSMRLINLEQKTTVAILCDKKLRQDLDQYCVDSNNIAYKLIETAEVAEKSGLLIDSIDPFAEPLFLHTLLTKKPANRYAKPDETRYSRLRKFSNFLLTSSVFVMLISLIWSSLNLIEGVTLKQQTISTQEKADFYRERYDIASARLPDLPLEPVEIKNAVEIIADLRSYKSEPGRALASISTGLSGFPDIQIASIDWQVSLDPEALIGSSQSASQASSNTTRPAEPGYNNQEQQYRFYEIAEIEGYIEPFDGDFRGAIADINQFAEIVRAQADVHKVKILAMPLDVSSTGKLQGTAEQTSREALFSLRIVQGVGREE
ncbi:MAG: hypothetical protein WDZ86_05535, partial [Gammaproteobacteria bacterium]